MPKRKETISREQFEYEEVNLDVTLLGALAHTDEHSWPDLAENRQAWNTALEQMVTAWFEEQKNLEEKFGYNVFDFEFFKDLCAFEPRILLHMSGIVMITVRNEKELLDNQRRLIEDSFQLAKQQLATPGKKTKASSKDFLENRGKFWWIQPFAK